MKNRYVIHRDEKFVFAIIDRGQLGSPVVFETRDRKEAHETFERLSFAPAQGRRSGRPASGTAQGPLPAS
jgi:hypothetical protein